MSNEIRLLVLEAGNSGKPAIAQVADKQGAMTLAGMEFVGRY